MEGTNGRPGTAWPADFAGDDDSGWQRRWTIATDALARASIAAAAATTVSQLGADCADALVGSFADWALVDWGSGRPARAVAADRPDPALADLLAEVSAEECPLIRSAMRRCAPLVAAAADDDSLGRLPCGRQVTGALGASSAAVAPVVSQGVARGAVTIVRCPGSPGVAFVELGVLSQIADLAGAAGRRLNGW
jgi:hypothetical protein